MGPILSFYRRFGKRAFDVAISGGALIVLLPLLLFLVAAVAMRLGRPVLFRQCRTGGFGRPFEIFKFRSMVDALDLRSNTLPDEQRLTSFGVWLRSSSLDELPGLFNILRGEMSVVGPRPLLPQYDALYSLEQARRLEARPGITGLAQVSGRNAISWPAKFALDGWYVDHVTFGLDLRIIWRTIWIVISRHGINDAEGALVAPFQGETSLPSDFDPADVI